MVFSANPEDYTARGKIITPLKDRIGSEIRTHYPASRQQAMAITAQEAWTGRADGAALQLTLPDFVREVVEEVAFQARAGSEDRQAIGRQPAAAHLAARERRLERRAAGAGDRRVGGRAARHRRLRGDAGDHRQVRARVRGRAERRRQRRARADPHRPSATCSTAGSPTPIIRQVTEWFDLGGNLQVDDTLSAAELLSSDRAGAGPARAARAGWTRQAPGRRTAGGGDRLRARRALRAEEDQPLRRRAVPGRRAGASARRAWRVDRRPSATCR